MPRARSRPQCAKALSWRVPDLFERMVSYKRSQPRQIMILRAGRQPGLVTRGRELQEPAWQAGVGYLCDFG
jgi:hypothetical protein